MTNPQTICLTLALSMVSMVGCSGRQESGGVTPEEAFEKFKLAEAKEDYQTAFSQNTPASQQASLGNCVIWITMMRSFLDPTKMAEIERIYAKYGVRNLDLQKLGLKELDFNDLGEVHQQIVGDVRDKAACIGEVLPWINKNCPVLNQKPDTFAKATLVGIKIDGEHASGTIEFPKDSKESRVNVGFERISGRWFIDWTTNSSSSK